MFVIVYLVALLAGIVGVIAFGIHEGMTAGAVFLRVAGLVIGAQVLVVLVVIAMAGTKARPAARPSGQPAMPEAHADRDPRHWGSPAPATKRSAAHTRHS